MYPQGGESVSFGYTVCHLVSESDLSHSHTPHTHIHTYMYIQLSLPGQPLPSRLDVEVKSHRGDPDLFLCQTCTAPTQTRYTWCNQDVGDSLIQLSTDEKGFDVNKVNIHVV